MEFGRHIRKGLWAFADKSLPAVYGIAFILLVIRVLPSQEYGAFVIIQTMIAFSSSLCNALALQPLTKFAAEYRENARYVSVSLMLSVAFYAVVTLLILAFRGLLVQFFDAGANANLGALIVYVPVIFLASFYRNFAINYLQASYQVQKIFWIDAVYFLGVLVLVAGSSWLGRFSRAEDLLQLTVIAFACSTLLALVLLRRQIAFRFAFDGPILREVWDYGKYTLGATIGYNIFSQADVFFVSSFGGLVAVATYNAAKILTRLFDMLSQVIQMFVLPASSKLASEGKSDALRAVTEKAILFSSLLLLPLLLVMVFLPGPVLQLLYHGKYADGAPVMQIFGVMALIIPWNAVCGSVTQGIGRVKYGFMMSFVLLFLTAVTFPLLVPMLGLPGAAIAYVTTIALVTVAMVVYTRGVTGFTILGVFSRIADVRNFLTR